MTMNLGYIDFLNCYPFYYHLFEKEPAPNVQLFPDYPGQLNTMLANGQLHMSPVSSAACAETRDEILVLPEFCLSSVGYIGSVTLTSRYPIEDLNGRTVGVTSASHTSAILLKILLQQYYHSAPVYMTTGPRPTLDTNDAALLIGNDAMIKAPRPAPYTYDLGDLWLRKTGYPVVFAVFAVRKAALEKHETQIQAVISSFHKSLACLNNEKETVIECARRKYPDILYDVGGYYDLFCFDFTDELKAAAMFYFHQANKLGLLPNVDRLEYL